jgi:large subunit ribosomal protein L46
MNTWVVGKAPIGHYERDFKEPTVNSEEGVQELGEKVFFMKARIFAGQADMTGNALGFTDFQWLSKDELEKVMSPRDYSSVRNMLATR